jgi:hypothetical protein
VNVKRGEVRVWRRSASFHEGALGVERAHHLVEGAIAWARRKGAQLFGQGERGHIHLGEWCTH